MTALLPWLYLRGVSAGDYQNALAALLSLRERGPTTNPRLAIGEGPLGYTRTINPIESALAMVCKRLESAQKNWKRIKGLNLLTLVVNNMRFKDSEQVQNQSYRNLA